MKKAFLVLGISLLSFNTPRQDFKALFQLTGHTWQMKTAKGYVCEKWKKISDTELSGVGFRVKGADTVIEEYMQLVNTGNGILFIGTVIDQNGGKPVIFKLSKTDNGTYIFSNPQHDYPQQVAYQLQGPDLLNAWIDGSYNGKQKRIDFHYTRAKD